MGFFTDAYDLFVIGIVATLLKHQWHLGSGQLALLNAVMLGAAFLGATVFGRVADLVGRKRVYWLVAAIMVIAAIGSALAPTLAVLIAFRFLLGFGVGGDYPVSAVLMTEYANRKDRGKLVGLVFSAQALGLVVGPLIALALLGGGVSQAVTWRVLLGLGAVPAAAVVYLRRKMPESPRYQAQVAGAADADAEFRAFAGGTFKHAKRRTRAPRTRATGIGMTTAVMPFLIAYGISYFFTEFGPNVTTFVLPGELFPVSVRATGHGISAGIGKFGAFLGVFLFPVLQDSFGLRGTLLLRPSRDTGGPASPRRTGPTLTRTSVIRQPSDNSKKRLAASGP
jgi:MFS transporter, PHS family, inorganic phosphate transporter